MPARAPELVYVSRLVRLPLVDSEGLVIGRIDDVVIGPAGGGVPPPVLGFVALVQRRAIFVNANRVGTIGADGAQLRAGAIDLRRFELRGGEILAKGGLLDRLVPDGPQAGPGEEVVDIGLCSQVGRRAGWEVSTVALGRGRLRRRSQRVVPWSELRALFEVGPLALQVAQLRRMHPSEIARVIRRRTPVQRQALAEALQADELADVLEELPEAEQLDIIDSLDLERAADVLEEMQPDDAVDLLAEMSDERASELLEAMVPEEAAPLRRLLSHGEHTAGGLMTSEPVIVTAETPVARVLARLRHPELPPALAAQVFVTRRPTATPTGRLLGVVGFQRLLREAPALEVGHCIEEDWDPIGPDVPELEVATRLAQYNLLAVPVCDEEGRLLGAVTVDDVLDRTLPTGWRP